LLLCYRRGGTHIFVGSGKLCSYSLTFVFFWHCIRYYRSLLSLNDCAVFSAIFGTIRLMSIRRYSMLYGAQAFGQPKLRLAFGFW
jgi:hypothetical protein